MSGNCCKCRPFYYDCECDCGVDVLAMLRAAMKDEKEAMQFYRYMIEKSQCEADKEMFRQIRCDERKHYRLLQEIYRDLTCECYCVDKVCVKKPKGFCRAMKQAICNEMQAISNYEQIANCLTDIQHREIICSIINDERCHAQRIAALYQFAQECACRCGHMHNNNCNQNHNHCGSQSRGRWVCNCEYECADPCDPCNCCSTNNNYNCGCCDGGDDDYDDCGCCDYDDDDSSCGCKDDDYYYYFCC